MIWELTRSMLNVHESSSRSTKLSAFFSIRCQAKNHESYPYVGYQYFLTRLNIADRTNDFFRIKSIFALNIVKTRIVAPHLLAIDSNRAINKGSNSFSRLRISQTIDLSRHGIRCGEQMCVEKIALGSIYKSYGNSVSSIARNKSPSWDEFGSKYA